MTTYLVKGRGPNRGKYLRWQWCEGHRRATWVAGQARAERFKYDVADEARRSGGYAVRLVAPKVVASRHDEISTYLDERAQGARASLDCYCLDGDPQPDDGSNYCYDCGRLEARRLRRKGECRNARAVRFDGGHDTQPRCELCDAKLWGSLTDYCVDQELWHFGKYPPTTPDGWDDLRNACDAMLSDDPRWRKVARIVDRAKARDGLVELLRARAAGARATNPTETKRSNPASAGAEET